jgi:hypothetical protein
MPINVARKNLELKKIRIPIVFYKKKLLETLEKYSYNTDIKKLSNTAVEAVRFDGLYCANIGSQKKLFYQHDYNLLRFPLDMKAQITCSVDCAIFDLYSIYDLKNSVNDSLILANETVGGLVEICASVENSLITKESIIMGENTKIKNSFLVGVEIEDENISNVAIKKAEYIIDFKKLKTEHSLI